MSRIALKPWLPCLNVKKNARDCNSRLGLFLRLSGSELVQIFLAHDRAL